MLWAPSVGRCASQAPVTARTRVTALAASSRTMSIWCAAWLKTTPPPASVCTSSGRPGAVQKAGVFQRMDQARRAGAAAGNDRARLGVGRIEAVAMADDELHAG